MGCSCSRLPCLSFGHTRCELDHVSFWSWVPRERSLKWFLPAPEPGPWAKGGSQIREKFPSYFRAHSQIALKINENGSESELAPSRRGWWDDGEAALACVGNNERFREALQV